MRNQGMRARPDGERSRDVLARDGARRRSRGGRRRPRRGPVVADRERRTIAARLRRRRPRRLDGPARRGVAAVRRRARRRATLALWRGCGKLQGFGGPAPPLVTFNVVFNGDLAPLRPPGDTGERSLQVALVWGAQWLTEPFCILPPEIADAAAVIAAGCRDPFGFVPAARGRERADHDRRADVVDAATCCRPPTSWSATSPRGSPTRSLVVYDDRDDSGTLELSRPHRTPFGREGARRRPPAWTRAPTRRTSSTARAS